MDEKSRTLSTVKKCDGSTLDVTEGSSSNLLSFICNLLFRRGPFLFSAFDAGSFQHPSTFRTFRIYLVILQELLFLVERGSKSCHIKFEKAPCALSCAVVS